MIIEKNNILRATDKKPILFDSYYERSGHPKPVALFCHGYKGFKDWGAWNLVAEAFAEAGFFFLKFNFSHNGGTVQQPEDFPDLEAFAQNNFSKELEDLDRMLVHILNDKKFRNLIDPQNVSLIGHSRGGGIVLIKAEEDPRIRKVVTWASVSDFKMRFNLGSPAFEAWRKTGRTYVENARTRQQMPHDWQFYEDFKENEERLSIERAVGNLTIPQLIIHGKEDPTIDVREATRIHRWNPKSSMVIIEGTDHVFGARHPWKEKMLPASLQKVVDRSVVFLKK